MKKIAIALVILLSLLGNAIAQDVTLRDTLWLRKATHVDYDLESWDTVFVVIVHGVERDTVFLSSNGKGRWNGFYVPSYSGNFVAEYNAVYSSDTTVEEQYFTVLDTAAFHGAAELTVEEIVTEFEDRGYGYGSGVFACTVYTKLFSDSSVIPNIHVIVKNTDQTQLLANGYTNANGWVVLGLDGISGGALHKFWLMNIEYSFDFPESADINTDTSVTFYGTAFDYGDPPAENQCAVYGQIFDSQIDSLSSAVVKAKVFVPPDSVLRYDNHVISPFIVSDTTNVTGRWRLDLIPNNLFTPTGTWYIFTIEKPSPWGGTIVDEDTLTVPELESHEY